MGNARQIIFAGSVSISAVLLVACGGGSTELQSTPVVQVESGHSHDVIQFSNVDDGVWPPQPSNITNVESIAVKNANTVDSIKLENTLQKALSNTDLQAALGNNYTAISSQVITDKSSSRGRTDLEYFNYDRNQVVLAAFADDNSIDIKVQNASDYQPPETRAESARAITLASQALSALGYHDHQQLIGSALLAYPGAAQVADSGKQFYAERKLYVTFGPGEGELPHYRALVNLSTGSVENSGPMQ